MTELMSKMTELTMVSGFELTYEVDCTSEMSYCAISPYEVLIKRFPDVPIEMIRKVARKLDARGRWIKKKDDQSLWAFAHGAYL